jgi:hypothetical protein
MSRNIIRINAIRRMIILNNAIRSNADRINAIGGLSVEETTLKEILFGLAPVD